MLNEINIQHLREDTDMSLNNYHVCLDFIVCPESSSSYFLGECEICPGTAKLKENLRNAFDEHRIDEVRFEIWLQTDRCTLLTLVTDTDEFLDDFCKRLLKLKTHYFVSKMQSSFLKNLKENVFAGEFLICFDFAENYAFIVQNSAQSFHWNNDQPIIFTVVIYYKDGGELKHISIAIISDNLAHDTVAVHEYRRL